MTNKHFRILLVGTNIFASRGGGQTFLHQGWGTNIFTQRGGQTFYVGGSGGYDDVYEEVDVSEANIFVSEVIRLSVGARIYRGP